MSSIALERVGKRFGEVDAVVDLDLTIEDEEFMVLLGPSGCGKTTVLRIIAGLDRATTGTVRIGDRVVDDVEAKDRDVAMVFQSYALYPHLTVAANVESPLVSRRVAIPGEPAPRRLRRDERAARVQEAAATLGLEALLDRKPGALSGGQRQRVALARAIVRRPVAFLMDEPLSNLDAKLRAQTRVELAELHRRLSTTFVYVTHDQVEAMTMGSRLAILDQGRLQQVGTPREIYERPANLFVARFIGSPPMNTLPGQLAVDDGASFVDVAAGRLRLPPDAAGGRIAAGDRVVAGVRPELLRRGPEGIAATVKAVEWLGSERHVVCGVGEALVTARESAAGTDPSPGQLVHLTCDPDDVHLFDAVTGERVR